VAAGVRLHRLHRMHVDSWTEAQRVGPRSVIQHEPIEFLQ
jgi:hypothetical protein